MHPRTVVRPPRTPFESSSAFHTMEPPGRERHRRVAREGERAGASESNALQRPHHANAFTLIELLVVIAIVAILIGLLLPSLFGMYERARKAQAKNDLTQIVNAVNAFYTEYGKYPLPAGTTTDMTYPPSGPGGSNADLFYTLRAVASGANTNNAINTRQIVYISPRVLGTAPVRSGIASDDGQFYDSWQTPYNVRIDGNYDNQITTNPYGNNNGAGPMPLPQGVIAWSVGKDHILGNGGAFTGSDDVISWQ